MATPSTSTASWRSWTIGGLTVTEDLPPADAERYVFKRFRYRLPEVLGELYFVATKEGENQDPQGRQEVAHEQERVDAPQVAAKRWKSIKLEHDGREIRLRDWRDFRGKYTLFRRNVEDWNEGDEQARLLSMLPEAWIKRVTKEESKRAKSNHTVKMMLPKEYHTNVVAWAEEERGPGCQTALPAERSSHHRLGRSREDRDVAP